MGGGSYPETVILPKSDDSVTEYLSNHRFQRGKPRRWVAERTSVAGRRDNPTGRTVVVRGEHSKSQWLENILLVHFSIEDSFVRSLWPLVATQVVTSVACKLNRHVSYSPDFGVSNLRSFNVFLQLVTRYVFYISVK